MSTRSDRRKGQSLLNKQTEILSVINEIKDDIMKTVTCYPLLIGFSGGLDSTALSYLAVDAIGKEHVKLIHVIYGPYTYSKTLENVLKTADDIGVELCFVDMRTTQEKVLKNGPGCNRCTKAVKIAGVKSCIQAENQLMATGANQSDSWGEYGFKVLNGVYAPFLKLNKDEINGILAYYDVERTRVKIGESAYREGCKAKHLLKMMASPKYHGHCVSLANEILLDILEDAGFSAELANVKIVGPLGRNIGLINIKPLPEKQLTDEIVRRLEHIDTLDEVLLVDKPLELKVIANPSIYRSEKARAGVAEGFLGREFAQPITCRWVESPNNKLNTYHVVEARKMEDK